MNSYKFNFTITDEEGTRESDLVFKGNTLDEAIRNFNDYKNSVYDYEIVKIIGVELL